MTRGIISKFIVVLIILFTAQGTFWFFKTSAVKKETLSLISKSSGQIGASSVSVSGFPFYQKLKITDLKFEPIMLPGSVQVSGGYKINIKNFEATSNIFSNNFVVTNLQGVALQDGIDTKSIEFNSNPKISFSASGSGISKFSYLDNGYKIIDLSKNILFENGSSMFSFESSKFESSKGDEKLLHNVKANFKDVGTFNSDNKINNSILAQADISAANISDQNNNQPNINSQDFSQENNKEEKSKVIATQSSLLTSSNLTKKNISLEIEYILAVSAQNATLSSPDEIVENISIAKGLSLESLNIKNFTISSPLYKIVLNGVIKSFKENSFPIGQLSLRIEKLDNILVYLKKYFPDININLIAVNPISNSSLDNPGQITENTLAKDAKNNSESSLKSNPDSSNSESSSVDATVEKVQIDIFTVIKNLSKKNSATNDEIAIFDFQQEMDKDLMINETPLPEIISQFVSFDANNKRPDEINLNDANIIIPQDINNAVDKTTPNNPKANENDIPDIIKEDTVPSEDNANAASENITSKTLEAGENQETPNLNSKTKSSEQPKTELAPPPPSPPLAPPSPSSTLPIPPVPEPPKIP
jgi:hypothetical protein